MNRRGNMFDAFQIVPMLFIIGILTVIAIMFMSSVKTAFTGTDAETLTTTVDTQAVWTLDFFFMMLLVSLPLASMILAFFNNIPPFFFWASIGIIMLAVILGSAFGDAWTSFVASGDSATAAARMPMMNLVLTNFGVYTFLCILIIAAGIFIKTQNPGGYGQ